MESDFMSPVLESPQQTQDVAKIVMSFMTMMET